MPITYVGIGAKAAGDHTTALTVALPAGITPGDLILLFQYLRNAGTLTTSHGWNQYHLTDATQFSSNFYLKISYRFADGAEPTATVTPVGGVASPQSMTVAFSTAWRGVDKSSPFGTIGTASFNAVADNVGPIAAPTALEPSGAVIVFGVRNGTVWTSVATLSGDSLTWGEAQDNYTSTVNGIGVSTVMDYALWSGAAPTLTAKTFAVTGGAGSPGMGIMILLNAERQLAARPASFGWLSSQTKYPTSLTVGKPMAWVGEA